MASASGRGSARRSRKEGGSSNEGGCGGGGAQRQKESKEGGLQRIERLPVQRERCSRGRAFPVFCRTRLNVYADKYRMRKPRSMAATARTLRLQGAIRRAWTREIFRLVILCALLLAEQSGRSTSAAIGDVKRTFVGAFCGAQQLEEPVSTKLWDGNLLLKLSNSRSCLRACCSPVCALSCLESSSRRMRRLCRAAFRAAAASPPSRSAEPLSSCRLGAFAASRPPLPCGFARLGGGRLRCSAAGPPHAEPGVVGACVLERMPICFPPPPQWEVDYEARTFFSLCPARSLTASRRRAGLPLREARGALEDAAESAPRMWPRGFAVSRGLLRSSQTPKLWRRARRSSSGSRRRRTTRPPTPGEGGAVQILPKLLDKFFDSFLHFRAIPGPSNAKPTSSCTCWSAHKAGGTSRAPPTRRARPSDRRALFTTPPPPPAPRCAC